MTKTGGNQIMTDHVRSFVAGKIKEIDAAATRVGDTIQGPDRGWFRLELSSPIIFKKLSVGDRFLGMDGHWYVSAFFRDELQVGIKIAGGILGRKPQPGPYLMPQPKATFRMLMFEPVILGIHTYVAHAHA